MTKIRKRSGHILTLLLSLVILMSTLPIGALTAFAAKTADGHEDVYAKFEVIYPSVGDYIASLGTPGVGSVGGEWMVIGLARNGRTVPDGYYDAVVKYVQEKINDKEQLHRAKSTDNSRVILALTALGYDVTDIAGHNLLMGLNDMSYIKRQGINGPIWALIAFDSHNYEIPSGDVTRDALIAAILDAQLADGGWALSGTNADPDMTAMAIQSLAPYYGTNEAVTSAVDNALNRLSDLQTADGGYHSWGTLNSESCAQVIVALTALGIDPQTDSRFIKNGCSVLEALMTFYTDGGGFRHTMDGGLNGMATEQGYYALAAYARWKENKTSLYDMSDVYEEPALPDDPNQKPDDNEQDNQTTEPGDDNQENPATKPGGDNQENPATKPGINNQGAPSSKPNGDNDVHSPQTGENITIVICFGLTMLSLAGFAATLAASKRRNTYE